MSLKQQFQRLRQWQFRGTLKAIGDSLNHIAHSDTMTTVEKQHLLQAMYHVKAAGRKDRDHEAWLLFKERRSK